MHRVLFVLALAFLLLGGTGLADQATKTGVLLDAMCGENIAGDADKTARQTVACATSPSCKASGYGIAADGKFYKFDQAGDKQASEVLGKTKKKSNVTVKVTGDFSGTPVKVARLEEVD
jgi:hypothetical protein